MVFLSFLIFFFLLPYYVVPFKDTISKYEPLPIGIYPVPLPSGIYPGKTSLRPIMQHLPRRNRHPAQFQQFKITSRPSITGYKNFYILDSPNPITNIEKDKQIPKLGPVDTIVDNMLQGQISELLYGKNKYDIKEEPEPAIRSEHLYQDGLENVNDMIYNYQVVKQAQKSVKSLKQYHSEYAPEYPYPENVDLSLIHI